MRPRHVTYRYLSAPERLVGALSYKQFAQMLLAAAFVIALAVWAPWPAPIFRVPIALIVGGFPVAVSIGMSGGNQSMSASRRFMVALRWNRLPKTYLPGARMTEARYVIAASPDTGKPVPLLPPSRPHRADEAVA